MFLGHDILITVDEKMQSQFYRTLVSYIGSNNPKEFSKETTFKNGIRIIQKNCSLNVSKGKIKKWAQTRLYFCKHTIVMDIDNASSIFEALLKSLYAIQGKSTHINNLMQEHFNIIMNNGEPYSRQLAILEDIYRKILMDSGNNANSEALCNKFTSIDRRYN